MTFATRYGTVANIAVSACLACALAACIGDGDAADDGAFHACGGKLAGTWKIVRIDLDDSSKYISQPFENQPACIDAIGDAMLHAKGSYVFGKDMSLKIELGLSADLDVTLDEICVQALAKTTKHVGDASCSLLADHFESESGMKAASCAAKGHTCECTLSGDEVSGSEDTDYEVRGHQLVVGGTMQARDYCVTGDRLEIRIERGTLAGLLVLKR
jgi:hypothetical protein